MIKLTIQHHNTRKLSEHFQDLVYNKQLNFVTSSDLIAPGYLKLKTTPLIALMLILQWEHYKSTVRNITIICK